MALVVPMLRAVAVAVSMRGVVIDTVAFAVPVTPRFPVMFVASCNSIVLALLRTMLPLVVVVRLRFPAVVFKAWLILVAERLLRLVFAPFTGHVFHDGAAFEAMEH